MAMHKPIASCTRDSPRALSKLRAIARNYDLFIALFAFVVIGGSNYFGIGFCYTRDSLLTAQTRIPSGEASISYKSPWSEPFPE